MEARPFPDKNYLRATVVSILVALLIFLGGGWLFVKIVGAAQRPRLAAEEKAEEAKQPTTLKLPDDIPLYKSGNVGKGQEYQDVVVYEIIFTLGSIEEVKDFYKKEMPARGWEVYAEGSSSKIYLKAGGKQKASMNWEYYAGKPRLRLTLAKTSM